MYGILVVRDDEDFQIIGAVDSVDEPKEMAHGYPRHDPVKYAICAPAWFEIHRRDSHGFYTRVEGLALK